jgi:hypothetical protein
MIKSGRREWVMPEVNLPHLVETEEIGSERKRGPEIKEKCVNCCLKVGIDYSTFPITSPRSELIFALLFDISLI